MKSYTYWWNTNTNDNLLLANFLPKDNVSQPDFDETVDLGQILLEWMKWRLQMFRLAPN